MGRRRNGCICDRMRGIGAALDLLGKPRRAGSWRNPLGHAETRSWALVFIFNLLCLRALWHTALGCIEYLSSPTPSSSLSSFCVGLLPPLSFPEPPKFRLH